MFHAKYLQRFMHCPQDKEVRQLPIQIEYEAFLIGRWIPMWQDRETGAVADVFEDESRPESLISWDVIQRKHDPFHDLRKSEKLERHNFKRHVETMGEQEARYWRGIDLPTAIKALTLDSAYVMNQDDSVGSIAEGKRADMIVLDKNLIEIPVTEISSAHVLTTIFDGKIGRAHV